MSARVAAATVIERVSTGPLAYLVSVPPRAEAPTPAVLCFLHGYDESAPMPIERALTLHGPLASSAAPAARERFLVVAPQLPRGGDVWHRAAADVLAVVEAAVQRFGGRGADSSRWLLTGFSFGGNGVFDLAAAQPGRWDALWPVDPTRVPSTRLDDTPLWLSIGAAARPLTPRFVRTLALDAAPAQAPGAGIAPSTRRLYLDEGHDHVGSATSAYGDARIYEWLLARSGDARRAHGASPQDGAEPLEG